MPDLNSRTTTKYVPLLISINAGGLISTAAARELPLPWNEPKSIMNKKKRLASGVWIMGDAYIRQFVLPENRVVHSLAPEERQSNNMNQNSRARDP